MAGLLAKLLEAPLPSHPDAIRPPRRLVLAGFGLDLKGTGYEHRVTLTRAYAFRAEARAVAGAGGGDHGQGDAEALYGDTGGPRVILEYEVR